MKQKNYPYLYEVGDVVNETLKITLLSRNNQNKKSYIVKSLVCLDAPEYEILESRLKKGVGCDYSKKVKPRIYEGNSLWSKVEFREHIIDVEMAKTLSPGSNKKQLFKCKTKGCLNTKIMKPNDLINQGYGCSFCSNSISYGHLAFSSYNKYFNLNYKSEIILEELPNRRFDFINFETGKIVEIQGEQHSNVYHQWYEQSHAQDIEKREFCKNSKYTMIEIDMYKSTWEHFKRQIDLEKDLPSMTKKDERVILEMMNNEGCYPVDLIIKMYTENKVSLKSIGEKYHMDSRTVSELLKRNNISIKAPGGKRKVKCIETGEVFNSLTSAAKWAGISSSTLHGNLGEKKIQKTAGKHPQTKEPLSWKYVE